MAPMTYSTPAPCAASLVSAIAAYRNGLSAFDALDEADWPKYGGEDAVIERTYLAPQRVLDNWSRPITSRAEAIAALGFAQEEIAAFGESPAANAMIKAVLGYLAAN